MQRLDKLLSEAGTASRRELKAILRAGRVTVNGTVVTRGEEKFDESTARITLDGVPVELRRTVLLMLHKPAGFVTSTDEPGSRTVMELLPERWRRLGALPVGRLDKDTEGLLLFTNDGQLAHKLISPRSDVWKVYYAEHDGTAQAADVEAFSQGVTLADGTQCLPARLRPIADGKCYVDVQEGKYHQVRRMLASRGLPVTYLKRVQFGTLELGDLPRGEVREIDPALFTEV